MALDDFTSDNEFEEEAPGDKRWREAEPGEPEWQDNIYGVEEDDEGEDSRFILVENNNTDTRLQCTKFVSLKKMV